MKLLIMSITFLLMSMTFPSMNAEAADTKKAHEHDMHKKHAIKIYIIEPKDGQTVTSPFKVKFALEGFGIAPAGTNKKNTGHHHLLIDTKELPDMTARLPATDKIKHFGGGQTETELTLSSGEHTLQLLLGDFEHIPHAVPIFSEKITVKVK